MGRYSKRAPTSALTYGDSTGDLGSRRLESDTVNGPASYATGGFVVDLSDRFSTVEAFIATVEDQAGAAVYSLHEAMDTPAAGQVTIEVRRGTYLRANGAAQNAPSGVTIADTANQTQGDPDAAVAGPAVPAANILYDHDHIETQTDVAEGEVPDTTDLSGLTIRYLAIGMPA